MREPSKIAEVVEKISDIAVDEDRITPGHTFERVLLHLGELALDPGLDGEHYRSVLESIGTAYADLAARDRGLRGEDSPADTVYNLVHELAHDDQLAGEITGCEAFGAFVTNLHKAGDGERDRMRAILRGVFEGLGDDQRAWLVDNARTPAAYLANLVR